MTQPSSEVRSQRAGAVELTESDRRRLRSAERREVALDVLTKRPTPVALEELAEAVAKHEYDVEVPPSDILERVVITLHHNHLPKMTDARAIEYDPTSRRIESVRVTADALRR